MGTIAHGAEDFNHPRRCLSVPARFENSGEVFAHTPVIVSVGAVPRPDNILIAAHSNDADYRPLDSYQNVVEWRFLRWGPVCGVDVIPAELRGEIHNASACVQALGRKIGAVAAMNAPTA